VKFLGIFVVVHEGFMSSYLHRVKGEGNKNGILMYSHELAIALVNFT